jgi:hypothetical protein
MIEDVGATTNQPGLGSGRFAPEKEAAVPLVIQ